MSHFFYKYKVYTDKNGVEYTVLKWIANSIYDETIKIDKPTESLTLEDKLMLNHFFEEGGIIQDKIDFPVSSNNLINNM